MTLASSQWRRLEGEPQSPVVLACDFDGTSRTGGTFDDLVRMYMGELEYDFWISCAPRSVLHERSENLLDILTQGIEHWAPSVHAVLGYCAGSVFAHGLADRIEALRGTRPIVVLMDPISPTLEYFRHEFSEAVRSMTEVTPSETQNFLNRADAVVRAAPDIFREGAEEIAGIYFEACLLNFGRLGIDSVIAKELADLFWSYGSYLSSAALIRKDRSGWDRCFVVASRDHSRLTPADFDINVDAGRLLLDPQGANVISRLIQGELS